MSTFCSASFHDRKARAELVLHLHSYTPPISPEAAIAEARNSFSFGHASKDILIDSFLNGPRTLHPGHLSHLFLSADPYVSSSENSTRKERFDLLICATHYLADLTAVHMIADELFTLLVSCPLTPSPATPNSIYAVLAEEFTNRNVEQLRGEWEALPSPLEHRIPVTSIGKFRSAVHKLDYARSQSRLIGGHAFPRAVGSEDRKHTVLLQASFTNERTKAILKQCKANGVTVNNCLFALCGLSWSKINGDKTNDLPLYVSSLVLFYSQLMTSRDEQNDVFRLQYARSLQHDSRRQTKSRRFVLPCYRLLQHRPSLIPPIRPLITPLDLLASRQVCQDPMPRLQRHPVHVFTCTPDGR